MPSRRLTTDTVQEPRLAFTKPVNAAITRVSSAEWVVSRGRVLTGDTAVILGFIQLSAGRYEVCARQVIATV